MLYCEVLLKLNETVLNNYYQSGKQVLSQRDTSSVIFAGKIQQTVRAYVFN